MSGHLSQRKYSVTPRQMVRFAGSLQNRQTIGKNRHAPTARMPLDAMRIKALHDLHFTRV
jgi:hypothetical protein